MDFLGFEQADFASYEAAKWGSNVYTLERMKTKDKVKALIQKALSAEDGQLTTLNWSFSEEHPSITNNKQVDAQWAYGIRGENDQISLRRFLEKTKLNENEIFSLAEYFKHLSITFRICEQGCYVQLFLHQNATIDRANLATKLSKTMEQGLFLERCKALPEGVIFNMNDVQAAVPGSSEDINKIQSFLNDESEAMSLGWFDNAADVIAAGAGYADVVIKRLLSLIPLYRFSAWSRDNDHIDVQQQVVKVKKQAKKVQGGIAKGDKIKVTGGLFAGREGQVLELDGRGGLKVSLGGLSVNIALGDCQRL